MDTMRHMVALITKWLYKAILKPTLFLIDAEHVHHLALWFGRTVGECVPLKSLLSFFYANNNGDKARSRTADDVPVLSQTIGGLTFAKPVGLAAGFDYRVELPKVLPAIDFGFGTVGTITFLPYQGNPAPRLGRLPKSKALLVNKGFKNEGIEVALEKLKKMRVGQIAEHTYKIGLSIGTTNTPAIATADDAAADLAQSFKRAVMSADFDYFELNISCPNLCHDISLVEPGALKHVLELLAPIVSTDTHKRPLFIKMPLGHSDAEVVALAEVAAPYVWVTGLIFSNLQKNRAHPAILPDESAKFARGHISGLPCRDESTSRIRAVRAQFGKRFVIIGCGGIFSVDDAYEKIRAGASLLQLITGMIFEGPQLIGEINRGLKVRLLRDGFSNISEAVGVDTVSGHAIE